MIKQNQIKSKAFIVFSKEYFWNITIRIKRGNLLKGYKKSIITDTCIYNSIDCRWCLDYIPRRKQNELN